MPKESVRPKELLVQAASAACICFVGCQTGFVCAWPSYTVANLTSSSPALRRPITPLEVSLLGALPNLGGLLASPFCGLMFDSLGRKYATMLFSLPYVVAWAMVSLSSDVGVVLAAMALAGVGIAGQNVSLIYIAEIAHDSVRGALTAASASAYFLGILGSYVLGGRLPYAQVAHAHLALALLCVGLLTLLRESPVYLLMVGREAEAAGAVAFYKRLDPASKEVEAEIAKLRLQMDPRLEGKSRVDGDPEESEPMTREARPMEKESQWKLLCKSRSSKRALGTTLVVIGATVMMGSVVLQVYAEPLFREAAPSLPPNRCALLLALDFLLASLLCVALVDRCGRKALLVATSAGSGLCTLALGVQLQLHWAPPWATALLIYAFSFVYTLGCAVVPFVLASEVFLPEVRGLCYGVAMGFVWVANFVTLVVFNPLVDALGLGPVFYCFAAVCCFGALYGYWCVPETKGLSPHQIQPLFLPRGRGHPVI